MTEMLQPEETNRSDSEPIRTPLEPNLKRENYTPAPISIINGFLLWGGSRIYRNRFGIGINEWRLLGKLSTFPGSTAADAIADLGMNKSIVSRSMVALLDKSLITTEYEGRTRHMYITPLGAALYHEIRPIAEERERIMLARLTEDEKIALRNYLVRMVEQGRELHDYDTAQLGETQPLDEDVEGD